MHAQGIYMLVGGFFRLPKDLPRPVWHYPVSYLGFHMYGLQVKKFSNFTFTTSCSGMCFLSISMQNSKQQIKDSSCWYLSAGDVQEWFSGTHIWQLYSKWKGHYSSDTWILCGGKHVWHPNQSREMGRPGHTVQHDSCVQTPVLHLHQTEWRLATTGSCLSDAISYCKEDQQQVVWFTCMQLPANTSSPSLPSQSPNHFWIPCMHARFDLESAACHQFTISIVWRVNLSASKHRLLFVSWSIEKLALYSIETKWCWPSAPTYIPLIFEEDMTQETIVFLGAGTSF